MENEAPVVFMVFNRPDVTRESFARIRDQQPTRLFIIADGPRTDRPSDVNLCDEVREVVANIDWPCEVLRNYEDHNLGCKQRVSSGLDWVFSHAERAIVIEDDCLPHPDFFRFCNEMLDRYEEDPRIATVTGDNFQEGIHRGDASYYFSKYVHVWGWATWKRAWDCFDVDMAFWLEWRESEGWEMFMPDPIERSHWTKVFNRTARGEIDTWDYQWLASTWFHGGLTAIPNVNLVTNVGFNSEATHTTVPVEGSSIDTDPIGAITHPPAVQVDTDADRYTFDHKFGGNQLRARRTPLGFVRWVVPVALRTARRRLDSWRHR